MSLFLPLKRATLLIPSGSHSDLNRKHLFILLTDPFDDGSGTKSVLMVSLSSLKPGIPHDPTCILRPGEHPFVKHDSYVAYRLARIEDADKILRGVRDGKLIPYNPMDSSVFVRICQGLESSRLTPPKIIKFYLAATGR